jgi:hypothetical protein
VSKHSVFSKNQKSSYLTGGSTTGRDGMPGCTDFTTSSGAARVLCVFETTEGTAPRFTVKSVVSSNDGVSFSERAQVFVPGGSGTNGSYPIKPLKGIELICGDLAGAPSVVTTTAGTLVVSFMTDEDTAAGTWYVEPKVSFLCHGH